MRKGNLSVRKRHVRDVMMGKGRISITTQRTCVYMADETDRECRNWWDRGSRSYFLRDCADCGLRDGVKLTTETVVSVVYMPH